MINNHKYQPEEESTDNPLVNLKLANYEGDIIEIDHVCDY